MEQIKQLRDKTGAGIGDCKKALEEANGDLDRAAEILREKGIAKAAKRADRETSEGVIKAGINENATEGYMLEINSETDFVSRNEQFQGFADKIFDLVKTQSKNKKNARGYSTYDEAVLSKRIYTVGAPDPVSQQLVQGDLTSADEVTGVNR